MWRFESFIAGERTDDTGTWEEMRECARQAALTISGPERPTEVEIAFAARGAGTEVTVVHRPKPSSEALWSERASRYERSWDAVLAALSRAATACLP